MRRLFEVLVIAVAILFCSRNGSAQNYPVYNSYFINPYLYNPAEAATENASLFLDHKRQWLGFEGAPVLSTLSFNTLLSHKRAGIGTKLSNYQRGILSTTDISFSYCYGLLLNKQKSTFFFGMSAGSISNSINPPGGSSDPAVLNSNNFQPTANFGFLLRTSKGFNFGFALPQLFTPDFNQQTDFGATKVTPLDNFMASFYYKKIVPGKLVHKKKRGIRAKVREADHAAPLELYTLYKYSKFGLGQFEATAKVNFNPNVWLAGGYRQGYGFIASGGFNAKNFVFNYSFEPGNQPEPGFSSGGTHEITLGLKLGKPKVFKRVSPLIRSRLPSTTEESHHARFQESVEDPSTIEQPQETDQKKQYYVILRGFGDFNSAETYKKKIKEQKYNAEIFYYEKEKKFYVYTFQSSKASEANDEAKNLRNYTKLKEARVLTVVEETK